MPPKIRVLVVENEPLVALDIQASLDRMGYEVAGAAASCQDAVRLAAETSPDAILMDIGLRGEPDGIAAAIQIRNDVDTPIVYMTAYSDRATLARATGTEPCSFLLKPFDEQQVHVALQMAHHRQRAERIQAAASDDRHVREGLRRRQQVTRLKERNRDLEDFAQFASHDLKAPLRGIAFHAKVLDEEAGPEATTGAKAHLNRIQASATRLGALVDAMLAYSLAGHLAESTVDVHPDEIVARVVKDLEPPPGFRVVAEGEFPVMVAATSQLERVFQNLVGNAIKHHDRMEGVVSVRAAVKGDFVEFAVQDDGPGVAASLLDALWEPFRSRDARCLDSTGLGLAAVKRLVEAHGGAVGYEPRTPRGSRFTFTWPKTAGPVEGQGGSNQAVERGRTS